MFLAVRSGETAQPSSRAVSCCISTGRRLPFAPARVVLLFQSDAQAGPLGYWPGEARREVAVGIALDHVVYEEG